MTDLPILTCDPSVVITRKSIETALSSDTMRDQYTKVSAWLDHLRITTNDSSIRLQGVTYQPNANGKMEPEPFAHTLDSNKAILAHSLSKHCSGR